MPLSKKRDRERKRKSRATYVQPNAPTETIDPVQPKFQPIGIPVKPTAQQKADKFKRSQT